MLTRRLATDLLTRFADGQPPRDLLGLLGFAADALPIAPSLPLLEGLPIDTARVAVGAGGRRALLVTATRHAALRTVVSSLAQRLHCDAPHHLWLVIAGVAGGASGAL
ncbi:MAG: hypothetical protein KBF56_02685, partial [Gemmatimonadaceae bacterium]|nr:hypothetical protein [Gemmatimonadaceae bacterium]